MKKLSCIIVDDEPVARKILHEFVEQVPFMDLQGKFENAVKAESFLKNNTVDMISVSPKNAHRIHGDTYHCFPPICTGGL